jgi:hypothetical protein
MKLPAIIASSGRLDTLPELAMIAGSFMESGHAGRHEGVDLTAGGRPSLVAARSGFYTQHPNGVNTIKLEHAPPDTTRYLHGDQRANHPAHTLVLQGSRLARMSDVGAPRQIHLHFELISGTPAMPLNPLAVLSLTDAFNPVIEAVLIRAAAGDSADVNRAATGISALADLIVRTRDQAHPQRASQVHNGPYAIRASDGVAPWPAIGFDYVAPGTTQAMFYAVQGQRPLVLGADNRPNHYLPYLRWDTRAYQRRSSPITVTVQVADYYGGTATREVTLGPEARLIQAPPTPATSSAHPQPFRLTIGVTNRTYNLNATNAPPGAEDWLSTESYTLALDGAPPGWSVAPIQTAPLNNGATAAHPQGGQGSEQQLELTITPPRPLAAGTYRFDLVVASTILTQLAARLPFTAEVH